jgi:hypothetical protein
MLITEMTFGSRTLYLSPSEDVSELQSKAVEAVRAGGGFITVSTAPNDTALSILISPGVALSFQSREVVDDNREPTAEDFVAFDWSLDI